MSSSNCAQSLKIVIVVIFGILLSSLVVGLRINEIMFNPLGSDSNHEWIEIYNNESSINVSEIKLKEGNQSHRLTLVQGSDVLEPNEYAIIAENAEQFMLDYPYYTKTLFDSSFSLSNSGELLELENTSQIFDAFFYNDSGIEEGKSLSYYNGIWIASSITGGTPGEENTIIPTSEKKGLKLSVYLDDLLFLGMTYTKLFKIENLNHVSGITDHINVTIGYNFSNKNQSTAFITDINSYATSNTGEFSPLAAGVYTLCGWIINSTVDDTNKDDDMDCKDVEVRDTTIMPCNVSISLTTEKIIYENGESIKFYNVLNNETFPYIIEYWVEDLFGNIIKNKYNTTNTNQKSFTTTIQDKEMACIIKNKLYPLCNDLNTSDNSAEQLVVIKGKEPNKDSSIDIQDVELGTDNSVKFGESFEVKIKVYKGDETKNQILAWVEDNGKEVTTTKATAMLYSKFKDYVITLPLQLKSNCDDGYKYKDYTLIVTGFDIEKKRNIHIQGKVSSLCSTIKDNSDDNNDINSDKEEITYSLVSAPAQIYSNQEFSIQLDFTNNDIIKHSVDVWSYVYRGTKCYSGEREGNKKSIELHQRSSITIQLENKILDAEPGDYNLKIKIRKDDQKTEKEITRSIKVRVGRISCSQISNSYAWVAPCF